MALTGLTGVTLIDWDFLQNLKQRALLFDSFCVSGLSSVPYLEVPPNVSADVEFLASKGIIKQIPPDAWAEVGKETNAREEYKKLVLSNDASLSTYNVGLDYDYFARIASSIMSTRYAIDAVPICHFDYPTELFVPPEQLTQRIKEDTLRVALKAVPVPDDSCGWEDILNFKSEMSDKLWSFRRFLRDLSTKRQSEAEIRDDIEWTVNEYKKAMKIHQMKSSQSAVDVFIVSPLEILEDLATFKWSKLAKSLLSVKTRQVELLEAEQKAPGRECAYVFELQRAFKSQAQTVPGSRMAPILAISFPIIEDRKPGKS